MLGTYTIYRRLTTTHHPFSSLLSFAGSMPSCVRWRRGRRRATCASCWRPRGRWRRCPPARRYTSSTWRRTRTSPGTPSASPTTPSPRRPGNDSTPSSGWSSRTSSRWSSSSSPTPSSCSPSGERAGGEGREAETGPDREEEPVSCMAQDPGRSDRRLKEPNIIFAFHVMH